MIRDYLRQFAVLRWLKATATQGYEVSIAAITKRRKPVVALQKLIYVSILRPLTVRDYRLQELGKRPRRWYWADRIAKRWHYFTPFSR